MIAELFGDEEGVVQLPHILESKNDGLAWIALTAVSRSTFVTWLIAFFHDFFNRICTVVIRSNNIQRYPRRSVSLRPRLISSAACPITARERSSSLFRPVPLVSGSLVTLVRQQWFSSADFPRSGVALDEPIQPDLSTRFH